MKILLVTRECLRLDSNEGNVLISIFGGGEFELANIYCKGEFPDVDVCQGRYFQLTDRMALDSILHHKPMGQYVSVEDDASTSVNANGGQYSFFQKHNWEIFYLLREMIWQMADIRNEELFRFVEDFAPDIIFAPLCPSRYALRVHRLVMGATNCPCVTYFYDDIYSLKQLRFSPIYWLNRFLLRGAINKNLKCCDVVYTMSEQQAQEYEKLIHRKLEVLRKPSGDQWTMNVIPHEGIRIIYAGGTYWGRDKTLVEVARTVRKLRGEGQNVLLDIYTNSPMSRRIHKELQDGICCKVHKAIPFQQLVEEYAKSDIALHVESFEKKYAMSIRLSFSTKIVDCLSSGCAVMAICPGNNSGWQYLNDENAAVCVDNIRDIGTQLTHLVKDADYRTKMSRNAKKCACNNHKRDTIVAMVTEQFKAMLSEQS